MCQLLSKILPILKEKKKKDAELVRDVPTFAAVWLCNLAILAVLVKAQAGAAKAVRGRCLIA